MSPSLAAAIRGTVETFAEVEAAFAPTEALMKNGSALWARPHLSIDADFASVAREKEIVGVLSSLLSGDLAHAAVGGSIIDRTTERHSTPVFRRRPR